MRAVSYARSEPDISRRQQAPPNGPKRSTRWAPTRSLHPGPSGSSGRTGRANRALSCSAWLATRFRNTVPPPRPGQGGRTEPSVSPRRACAVSNTECLARIGLYGGGRAACSRSCRCIRPRSGSRCRRAPKHSLRLSQRVVESASAISGVTPNGTLMPPTARSTLILSRHPFVPTGWASVSVLNRRQICRGCSLRCGLWVVRTRSTGRRAGGGWR